jgi:hypothetical protein
MCSIEGPRWARISGVSGGFDADGPLSGIAVVLVVEVKASATPAFLDGCALVRDIGEIKYARVRDIIGANSLVISSTSRGDP